MHWLPKLRSINAGNGRYAPIDTAKSVCDDYISAIHWLGHSVLMDWSLQWSMAPLYLSGVFLKRYQAILKQQCVGPSPRYVGVLRCIHEVEVRHFSEDGERCLIVDRQSSRRMATYDFWTHTRQATQDMGDGIVVFEMVYTKQLHRWRVTNFVQELPAGSYKSIQTAHPHFIFKYAHVIGRDN